MGTLANGLKTNFYGTGTNVGSSSHRVPLLDSAGNPVGSNTVANLGGIMADACATGGVLAVSWEENHPRFRQPNQAATYASKSIGVAVIEKGHVIVIAKDQQATTKWATSNVTGGAEAATDALLEANESTPWKVIGGNVRRNVTPLYRPNAFYAIADLDGRVNTAKIIETLGDNAPAAKYCNEYAPTGSTAYESDSNWATRGFGAGKWHLPALGELTMIWAHLREINRVLVAQGGTPLYESATYWSSTEHSAAYAWYLSFDTSNFFYANGKSSAGSVRPVAAFWY